MANIKNVDVQKTGFVAVNFDATASATEDELARLSLPAGYQYVGLLSEDGGYAEEVETGDETVCFEAGYSVQTGDVSIGGSFTLAETTAVTEKLLGVVDGARRHTHYQGNIGLIIVTEFENGKTVARGGIAHLTEVTPSQETRGGLVTYEVKFQWDFSSVFCGYYRYVTVQRDPDTCGSLTVAQQFLSVFAEKNTCLEEPIYYGETNNIDATMLNIPAGYKSAVYISKMKEPYIDTNAPFDDNYDYYFVCAVPYATSSVRSCLRGDAWMKTIEELFCRTRYSFVQQNLLNKTNVNPDCYRAEFSVLK